MRQRSARGPARAHFSAVTDRIGLVLKQAFSQFLALPLAVMLAFVALSALLYQADRLWSNGNVPQGFGWLGELLGDSQALNGLLTTVATSIITITSITFSLLPVAVQQGSSSLTAQVIDQFMMRRTNQFYFGFFVGLSIFALMTMVTASAFHRPVFAASAALVLMAMALCMIVVMIYNTIDQMRPAEIIAAIHRHILAGRRTEVEFLARTREETQGQPVGTPLGSPETGYVARFDTESLEAALARNCPADAELEILAPVGSHLAAGDPVFRLRGNAGMRLDGAARGNLERDVFAAVAFSPARDLSCDPSYGIFQLSMIAWTSVSTSKSNPGPGLQVLHALRDIISRWSADEASVTRNATARIVYPDRTPVEATDQLDIVIAVASESIQVQTLTSALSSVAVLLGHVSDRVAERLSDVADRALASLGEHVMTRPLDQALGELAAALEARGFTEKSAAVREAASGLRRSVGKLNSRSTRVPEAP